MTSTKHVEPKSSIDRALGLLDLFTLQKPVWLIEELVQDLDLARATVYRYVRSLCDAGLLVPAGGGGYVLGPRIVEFDRQIRLADPLLLSSAPVMAGLVERVNGAQLLCSFYGNKVLTIHQINTDDQIKLPMERGHAFPMFYGAPSRTILANLPSYQLKNVFLNYSQEITKAGLGSNWQEFRAAMRDIRRGGFYAASQLDPTLVGIASPIFRENETVVGCLCLVRRKERMTPDSMDMLSALAMEAAREISSKIQEFSKAHSTNDTTAPYPTIRLG